MDKLFLYACSFGKFGTAKNPSNDNWIDDNSFGVALADKLNLEFVNRSWPGGSNHHIFRKVMQDIVSNNIQENDLVIVQYSFINRGWCNDLSKTVMPQYKEFEDYYIRFYSDEVSLANLVSLNTYLKNKLKCKFVYSTAENIKNLQNINPIMCSDFTNDTRFFSIDGMGPITYLDSLHDNRLFLPCRHPSKEGHTMIADLYYKFISAL